VSKFHADGATEDGTIGKIEVRPKFETCGSRRSVLPTPGTASANRSLDQARMYLDVSAKGQRCGQRPRSMDIVRACSGGVVGSWLEPGEGGQPCTVKAMF
jgi:hypothetical protein